MGKLSNKTVIVTGAASGMGKSIAMLFAKEGANVVVSDLKKIAIDEVVDAITSQKGKATGIICNVANELHIDNLVETTLKHYGEIHVLINNAGIMDDFLPADKTTNSNWDKVLDINLKGPFFACRKALPIMLKQGFGTIINIASVGGLHGSRAGVAYTASKHALIGLTKNIGFMYAQKGIKCNAIAPGGVNTNIGKHMKPDEFGQQRCTSGGNNMPRLGEPDEIARIALFLACDDSSLINGTVITADAGWTAY